MFEFNRVYKMCIRCFEFWVGLGGNIWKKGRPNTISGHSRGLVPVPNSVVPVPHVFWWTGTGTEKSVPVPNVLFWTSVSV